MRSFLARNWKILTPVGVLIGALVAYLAFGVFGVHTLFIDDEVDEAGPVFASGAVAGDAAASDDDPAPEAELDQDDARAPAAEPEIVTVVSGSFIGRSHPAEGTALVLTDGTEQRFLRFEDFSTDNGPDLNVYLSTAPPDADESAFDDDFIDLGDLKGNIGSQNYEIPPDVDLSRYQSVVIWCVRFGVAFGAAELM
jgi:hypothetical protein